jgi:hypothetical protein
MHEEINADIFSLEIFMERGAIQQMWVYMVGQKNSMV